jgi:hypothetical protein
MSGPETKVDGSQDALPLVRLGSKNELELGVSGRCRRHAELRKHLCLIVAVLEMNGDRLCVPAR